MFNFLFNKKRWQKFFASEINCEGWKAKELSTQKISVSEDKNSLTSSEWRNWFSHRDENREKMWSEIFSQYMEWCAHTWFQSHRKQLRLMNPCPQHIFLLKLRFLLYAVELIFAEVLVNLTVWRFGHACYHCLFSMCFLRLVFYCWKI